MWLMRWILLGTLPLVQDRWLDLLTCSPVQHHCVKSAPCSLKHEGKRPNITFVMRCILLDADNTSGIFISIDRDVAFVQAWHSAERCCKLERCVSRLYKTTVHVKHMLVCDTIQMNNALVLCFKCTPNEIIALLYQHALINNSICGIGNYIQLDNLFMLTLVVQTHCLYVCVTKQIAFHIHVHVKWVA